MITSFKIFEERFLLTASTVNPETYRDLLPVVVFRSGPDKRRFFVLRERGEEIEVVAEGNMDDYIANQDKPERDLYAEWRLTAEMRPAGKAFKTEDKNKEVEEDNETS